MKKGTKLVALLLGLALVAPACSPANNPGKSSGDQTSSEAPANYKVTINNKEELQAAWYVGDQSRKVSIEVEPKANVNQLVSEGKIQITSSDPAKLTISGQMASPVAAGEVTITVKCGENQDTVKVTLSPKQTVKEKYGVDHEGTAEDPLSNEDAVKIAETVGKDATLEKFYIKGVVDSFRDAPSSYGNVSFYFTPATASGKKFLAYRVKLGEKNENVTDEHIWIGGTATVYVNIYNYNGNTPENNAGYLVKCEGERQTIENHEVNVAGAIAACKALGANGASDGKDTYDVTGYIVKVDGTNFYMSDTKGAAEYDAANHFEVYNYTGENKVKCTIDAKVKVSCTIKYYKSSTTDAYAYETSVITAVEILEEGQEPDLVITGAPALTTLTAGTYKLGLLQTNLNENCFFKGTFNSSKYGEVTAKWAEAVDVVVGGDATNGFTMKVGDKYISPVLDGTKVRSGLVDAAKTYQWNEKAHTLTTTFEVSGKTDTYYFGTYGTNRTLGFSALSYLIKDDKLVDGQFASQFYAKAECNADPTAVQLNQAASAVVGVPYALAIKANPYNVDLSKFTWESSDPTVATVANGVVTGLKAGESTITAKFGEEISDTCKVTFVEVDLGSAESPLTVKQALDAAQALKLSGSTLSPKKAYVKGVIATRDDTFVNGDYFGKYDIKNGDDKLYIVNSKPVADLKGKLFDNDEVIMSGFLGVDATNGTQMIKDSNNDYPVVESLATRGVSSITVGESVHAQVTELSATSGENLSTFTFKVVVEENCTLDYVKINGVAVTAGDNGVYTGTVKGNTVITVKAAAPLTPDGDPVTVSKTMTQLFGDTTATQDGEPKRDNKLDDVASFKVSGTGNSGKVYTASNNRQWRLYQGENPEFTVYVAEGYAIQSITVTYSPSSNGTLTYKGSNIASGAAVTINPLASSVVFGVGNTGTGTSGQARVTAISVTYVPVK